MIPCVMSMLRTVLGYPMDIVCVVAFASGGFKLVAWMILDDSNIGISTCLLYDHPASVLPSLPNCSLCMPLLPALPRRWPRLQPVLLASLTRDTPRQQLSEDNNTVQFPRRSAAPDSLSFYVVFCPNPSHQLRTAEVRKVSEDPVH